MTVNKLFSLSLVLLLFLILISIPLNQADAEELDSTAAAALVADQGTDVVVPNTYTSIGNGAFRDSELTSVTIPDSVTSIGRESFMGCSSLISVIIPDLVISIGKGAFQSCSELTSVTIPDSVTSIGNRTFQDTGLTSILIPNSVTSIGDGAFMYCSDLTSVVIPDFVTSIGDGAFASNTALAEVTIGNSVTEIGGSAFLECRSLTSVVIPDSVTSIGDNAFTVLTADLQSYESKLTSVIVMYSEEVTPDFTLGFGNSVIINMVGPAANLANADLTGGDLTNANLTGANLTRANLINANLTGVDLTNVNLAGALYNQSATFPDDFDPQAVGMHLIGPNSNLANIDLTGANLANTTLTNANLTGANLTNSDLTGANLINADMTNAILTNADLTDALFDQNTNFPNGFDFQIEGMILLQSTGSAEIRLQAGINMIALPFQTATAYTAKSLAQHLAGNNDNLNDDSTVDVTWVIRYHLINQKFEAYVWSLDQANDGFEIQGGQGYLAHVSSDRAVTFEGGLWSGVLNPMSAPSSVIASKTWAFVVSGNLTNQIVSSDEDYRLQATNLTAGKQLAEVESRGHSFRLPLVDLNRQDLVVEGDLVEVKLIGSNGKRRAKSQFRVGQQELASAHRWLELESNPVPDLTRLLQNYPNPFNPETWIPYQLSQDSVVKLSIYDVGGQLVRWMEVGFREAGIYSSREKAIYWDGKSQDGERVASGVYFYSLGEESQTRRMVILK